MVFFYVLLSLDFGRILEKSSLLCLECVLILPSLSSLQTSRFLIMIIFMSLIMLIMITNGQVVHHYLHSAKKGFQSRLRKRVRNGRATYTFTVRKPELQGQAVEVKQPISQRDYNNLLSHRYVIKPLSLLLFYTFFSDPGMTIIFPFSRPGARSFTRTSTISWTSTTRRATSDARVSSSWRPAPP